VGVCIASFVLLMILVGMLVFRRRDY